MSNEVETNYEAVETTKEKITKDIFEVTTRRVEPVVTGVHVLAKSNIVKKDVLRRVQKATLAEIKEVLANTYGPVGSNTSFLRGENKDSLVTNYTKDGHSVLKAITYTDPIELSIQSQLSDITHHVEHEVGDGTTSAVMLSEAIFSNLCDLESSATPYMLIEQFKEVVSVIQGFISENGRTATIDDIFDLCMISTNGNEEISNIISDIYKKHGTEVFVSIATSNTTDNMIKELDGLTLDEGFSDPAYINTMDGKSSIRNAKVYVFDDPIDTPEMISFFEKIIITNVIDPIQGDGDAVPTVIVAPRFSRDMSGLMEMFISQLYMFDQQKAQTQKPPVLVITNLGPNLDKMYDIAKLCGCKNIRKYIDPKIQAADVEKGLAPTLDTVIDFAGTCELVEADTSKTKFVNPGAMFELDENGLIQYTEDGPVYSTIYKNLLNFVQAELDNAIANSLDSHSIGKVRRRLQSLKANMVEFYVGGITIADRDALKDLVEDAIKNCRSASLDGIGFAANYEGFRASVSAMKKYLEADDIELYEIAKLIARAYKDIIITLYNSIFGDETVSATIVNQSLEAGCPYNIFTNKFDGKVLTSIQTDIKIIDAISKIITIMFTSNQALVQSPHINNYID